MKDLRKAFTRAGLYNGTNNVYVTTKIRRLEVMGRLKVPRTEGGQRRFTLDQIAEIVAAFLPSGPGCYFYKKPTITQTEMRAIKDAVVQSRITEKIKEMEKKNDTDRFVQASKSKVSKTKRNS